MTNIGRQLEARQSIPCSSVGKHEIRHKAFQREIFAYSQRVAKSVGPKVIELPDPAHSVLGELRVVEAERIFGFTARRTYWIEGVPEKDIRGHHAHKELNQAIVLLRGSSKVILRTPDVSYEFHLASPGEALLIPPGFWREMSHFSADALMFVFASDLYDESDYIRDWNSYVEFFRSDVR